LRCLDGARPCALADRGGFRWRGMA